MKKLIFLLLISSASFAQVTIPIDSIEVGGIKFKAQADFECMIWNTRTKSVSLQWKLKVIGRDASIVAERSIEQLADNSTYVYEDGSIVVDSIYYDSSSSGYRANGWPVMVEYDFYAMIAQHGAGGATINQLIQTAGLRRKKIFKL